MSRPDQRVVAALERAFAPDGPLAARVPGFHARTQQIDMARSVLDAIAGTGMLAVEAGTGTGKTFAYLVPALLAGGKVIISTGTKTLQDQLFERDLPTVSEALGLGSSRALLKGRSNYVCTYRLERTAGENRDAHLGSRTEAGQLRRIAHFAAISESGDRSALSTVPEDSPAWIHATSTRENCLGQECPNYRDCFVMKARKQALNAEVVVVNHHLFLADVALRDEGVSELLPACNTVIFDEAHQLAETARLFFGERLSTHQLLELARDARIELRTAGGASLELEQSALTLDKAARDLRLALPEDNARLAWSNVARRGGMEVALHQLANALEVFAQQLQQQSERSEGMASCARRAAESFARLVRFEAADSDNEVRWVESRGPSLQLHVSPLSPAEMFQRQMRDHPRAWIFTSATLAVGEDFSHFTDELGIGEAATHAWPSPYDFPNQGLFYVPSGMPGDPNDPAYTQAVMDAAWPVLKASGGRAFLLFTSLRALRRAHEMLVGLMQQDGIEFPLLVQGSGSRSELLDRFRTLGNAVLLGSQTFWEGVDVRGDALSLVVIDKLPFAPPDDPVLSARIDALRASGGNPFVSIQLPQATLLVKQGAGRLIRGETDRGVLMICDPRLYSKSYGRVIRASLPPLRPTRRLEDVVGFFAGGPG